MYVMQDIRDSCVSYVCLSACTLLQGLEGGALSFV